MKNGNNLLILIIILFTHCSTPSQSQDEHQIVEASLDQLYSDTINHYSIRFPSSWLVKPNYFSSVFAVGHSPHDSVVKNEDQGAFVLNVSSVSDSTTSSMHYNTSLQKIIEDTTLVITEKGQFDLNGKSTKFIVVKQALGNDIVFIKTSVYLVEDQRAFSLNGTVESRYNETFSKLFFRIAQTLKVQ
jgi:hypothetical protein